MKEKKKSPAAESCWKCHAYSTGGGIRAGCRASPRSSGVRDKSHGLDSRLGHQVDGHDALRAPHWAGLVAWF